MFGLGVKNDYYPFGMLVPNRNFSSPEYRYGFQRQEKDDEIKGSGNSLNYKFRMHDPRVGRFFAVDPLTAKYSHYTPYSFSGNKVIAFRELEGLEEENSVKYTSTIPYKPVFSEGVGSTIKRVDNAASNTLAFITNNTVVAGINGLKSIQNFTYNLFTGEYNNLTPYDLDNTISDFTNNEWNYYENTPIKEQFSDLGEAITNLETYDAFAQMYVAHRLAISFEKPIPIVEKTQKISVTDAINNDINRIIEKHVSSDLTNKLNSKSWISFRSGAYNIISNSSLIGEKFQYNLFSIVKLKDFEGISKFDDFLNGIESAAKGAKAKSIEINVLKVTNKNLMEKFTRNHYKVESYKGGFQATKLIKDE